MPKYQAFNRRIGAYVKYEFTKGGFTPLDVKQKEPTKPFKNVEIKGQRYKKKK